MLCLVWFDSVEQGTCLSKRYSPKLAIVGCFFRLLFSVTPVAGKVG
jgi:hypothetical protein